MEGIVIGMEIGSWAGFLSGSITIMCVNESRINFHYGRGSNGTVPEIGDYVSVEYFGEHVLEISNIAVVEKNLETSYERFSRKSTAIPLIWGRPKGAVAFAITEVFAGIFLIYWGLVTGISRPAAPAIFGVVGFAQLFLAWLIWEYNSRG